MMNRRATQKLEHSFATLALLVVALLFLSPGHARAQLTQNEPAGSTKLGECDFNGSKNCGVFTGYYGGGFLTNLPNAPYSPGGVYYDVLYAGTTNASGYGLALTGPKNRELYVSFYWKMSAGYIGGATGTKLFFMRGAGATPECNTNGFFGIGGTDGIDQRNFPYYMGFGMNTGTLVGKNTGNPTCGGWANGDVCAANVSQIPLYPDTWYHVEAYVRASSCGTGPNCPPGGSRDGIIRWWIDGQLAGDVTNYNYGCGNVNEFLFDHTWDGSTAWQCATGNPNDPLDRLRRQQCQELRMYLDHVYVSAPNCPNGCPVTGNTGGGGGGTTGTYKPRQVQTRYINLRPGEVAELKHKSNRNFFQIYGVPSICSLSAGTFSQTSQAWELTKAEMDTVKLTCPPEFCGSVSLTVLSLEKKTSLGGVP